MRRRARYAAILAGLVALPGATQAVGVVVASVPPGQDLAAIAVDGPYLAVAQDGSIVQPGSRVRLISLRGGTVLVNAYRESSCDDPFVWDVAVAGPRIAWNTTSVCDNDEVDEQYISRLNGKVDPTAPDTPVGRIAGGDSTMLIQVGDAIQIVNGRRRSTITYSDVLTPIAVDRSRVLTWNIATGGVRLYALSGRVLADIPSASASFAALDGRSIVALRKDAGRIDWYSTGGRLRRSFQISKANDGRVDVQGRYVIYTVAGRFIRAINLGTGVDRITQRAPARTKLVEAEIDGSNVVYAYRFGRKNGAKGGRVSAVPAPRF